MLQNAKKAASEGKYEEALDGYLSWAQENNVDEELPEIIEIFSSLYPESIVEPTINAIARYHFDFRPRRSMEEMIKEIEREIPFKIPLKKECWFAQGNTHRESQLLGFFPVELYTAQGPRPNMEDTSLSVLFSHPLFSSPILLLGVFDGHGGIGCAKYIAEHITEVLTQEITGSDPMSIYNGILRSALLLDQQWKSISKLPSGSTATFLLQIDDVVWTANVGDSGAIFVTEDTITQLTEEAKPTIEKYRDEIYLRGGTVIENRVDGSLDMARSIGDPDHPSVSALPTVKRVRLPKNGGSILLACDGLWDVISAEQAGQFLSNYPLNTALCKLAKFAYKQGSTDNITLLAAWL
jgi:serine/threonine protein phosphatase PrpC